MEPRTSGFAKAAVRDCPGACTLIRKRLSDGDCDALTLPGHGRSLAILEGFHFTPPGIGLIAGLESVFQTFLIQ
jgi:hypothetical protein